ncbi:ABC transporter permease [Enteroscipio rubneri]|uniref:Iron export ABC transporter permease subunit FetB n=1 Tax=Enteroscipio rubneri TaxID=2070686 RepID=A0A2K2U9E8_9ACTN|nr:iron export ABC transporter permease subunit FetB [Enteroscipio rubneri]PNV66961.1 iron export ABC transporter permease subunit FetB [Enteroscipio rubneri]
MTESVVDIGYIELFAASALMLVAGLVSWKLELGQTRRIVVSSVRCFVQLLAAGFLLTYLFEFQTWWLVLLVLAAMVIAATQIATARVKNRVPGLSGAVFVSLFVSSFAVGFIVVEGIVHAEPWYSARQLVPIVGMIMGNAMAAVAVAIDRLFADMDARASEMFSLVALGATPSEAAAPSLKAAIGAGMTPILANMSAAGIVTFPGMMTGQLLAGADPVAAAKYQIVVMLMLSAANTIAIVAAVYLTYRRRFSSDGYYLDKGIRADNP